MLEDIKLMLGIPTSDISKDSLINLIISDVELFILAYTKTDALTQYMTSLVKRIAVIRYNMIGSEGVAHESYSGVTQIFINGLPEDIKSELRTLRKVGF